MSIGSLFQSLIGYPRTGVPPKALLQAYKQTRTASQTQHLCHAPFKAMLLSNNGRVLSCCFNRQAILGTYPEQSLNNIWFGTQAQKLRRHIKQNDLSYGCFMCKNHLRNKEFHHVKARMFDHLPDNPAGYPSLIEFDLDNTCNLECVMCNADNSSAIRKHSPLYAPYKSPYTDSLVDELEAFIPHLNQASFAGGEPFLIKRYYAIWERILNIKPEVRITVTTNATILNNTIKELLERGFFEIAVSLDTINPDTYAKIRRNASFEETMRHLHYFRDYCKRKGAFFGVWACPLRINRFEIPELISHFGKENTSVYLHSVWVPPGVTLWNLPSEELSELIAFYRAAQLPDVTEVQRENKKRFDDYILLLESWLQMAVFRESNTSGSTPLQPGDAVRQALINKYRSLNYSKKDIEKALADFDNKKNYIQQNLPEHIYNEGFTKLATYPDEFIFQIFEAGTGSMIADFFKYLMR